MDKNKKSFQERALAIIEASECAALEIRKMARQVVDESNKNAAEVSRMAAESLGRYETRVRDSIGSGDRFNKHP